MKSPKPTILLVHGLWHEPEHYEPVRSIFEKAGYPTSWPRLPNYGAAPPVGLKEDVQCIKDKLTKLIVQEERDVIVLAHSYGGVVATQAVEASFPTKQRGKEGKNGGVVRLVYMCAFILRVGETLVSALGGALPPFIPVDEKGMCTMLDPETRFYNDLPPAQQSQWAELLEKCPAKSTVEAPISHAAYLHYPVTYLYCTEDNALLYEVQKMMAEKIKGAGIEVVEETGSASHNPFLSMPGWVLDCLERAC